jgi:uncharacterized protein (DUF4415 family)
MIKIPSRDERTIAAAKKARVAKRSSFLITKRIASGKFVERTIVQQTRGLKEGPATLLAFQPFSDGLVEPTEEEDAAITKAAEADPDSGLLTDKEAESLPRVRGPQVSPTKELVSIRLDRDLLESLRASGKGWQSRVNAILRDAKGPK